MRPPQRWTASWTMATVQCAEALRAWCRTRLTGYKVPARFVFVEQLPLTELGKVSRRELRRLLEG